MSLLTIPEVAERLRVSRNRAYELVRQSILPAVHMGKQVRVCEEALNSWIDHGGQGLAFSSALQGNARDLHPTRSRRKAVNDRRKPE